MAGRRRGVPRVHVVATASGHDIVKIEGSSVVELETGIAAKREAMRRAQAYAAIYRCTVAAHDATPRRA